MHVFLTGEIQVGKSTVIAKTLSLQNITYGGFKTYFGPDRASYNKLLYMNSAADSYIYNEELAVARFQTGCPPFPLTDKFNTLGVQFIRQSRLSSDLIIMDECGSLERDATLFQEEILNVLDGSIPVLGVIKLLSKGWTDCIRNHPNVKLITVTHENRNELPQVIPHFIGNS